MSLYLELRQILELYESGLDEVPSHLEFLPHPAGFPICRQGQQIFYALSTRPCMLESLKTAVQLFKSSAALWTLRYDKHILQCMREEGAFLPSSRGKNLLYPCIFSSLLLAKLLHWLQAHIFNQNHEGLENSNSLWERSLYCPMIS